MKFINKHLRFEKLTDGDLCVAKLKENVNWNKTGITLVIYKDGLFFDAWVKEDEHMLDKSWWEITDIVESFSFTGENYG